MISGISVVTRIIIIEMQQKGGNTNLGGGLI